MKGPCEFGDVGMRNTKPLTRAVHEAVVSAKCALNWEPLRFLAKNFRKLATASSRGSIRTDGGAVRYRDRQRVLGWRSDET